MHAIVTTNLSCSLVPVRVVQSSLTVLCALKATAERQNLTATWKKLMESKVNSFGDSNALSVVRGNPSERSLL